MAQNKIYSMIGLAMKAGKLTSGEFSTEHAVKAGKAYLVIVSETASENTKKKFRNMCTYYEVPLYFFGEKETLGHAMERSSVLPWQCWTRICKGHRKCLDNR